jgi:hypothetical protein
VTPPPTPLPRLQQTAADPINVETLTTTTNKQQATALDFLHIKGDPALLEFLDKVTASSSIEKVVFTDTVLKVNQKGNFQVRHLLVTDQAMYIFIPGRYKTCQREIRFSALLSVFIAARGDEVLFQVNDDIDYRFVLVRK